MNVHPEECAGRPNPDAVEGKYRTHGWKGRQRGRVTEDLMYPTKWASPQKPFVEIAHQNTMLGAEALQQLLDLGATFSWSQSQMGRNDLEVTVVTFKIEVDRSSRFTARLADVNAPNLLFSTPC